MVDFKHAYISMNYEGRVTHLLYILFTDSLWTPLSPIDTHTGTSSDSSVVEAAAVAVDGRSGVRSGPRAACPRVGR